MDSYESTTSLLKPRTKDLTGERFDNLVVIAFAGYQDYRAYWICRCDCGKVVERLAKHLLRRQIHTCGCGAWVYGQSDTSRQQFPGMYNIFHMMWRRCTDPKYPGYKNYGGRGIYVTERWKDFDTFIADIGPRPSLQHSLDRYPDQNGPYSPENTRWATPVEQGRNKRNNHLLTLDGMTQPLSAWAEQLGVHITLLTRRLNRGLPVEKVLSPPTDQRHLLTYQERTQTISEWAREIGLKPSTLTARIRYGWTIEQALTEQQLSNGKYITFNDATRSMRSWARITGIPYTALTKRFRVGWPVERALTQPLAKQGRRGQPPEQSRIGWCEDSHGLFEQLLLFPLVPHATQDEGLIGQ